MTTVLLRRLLMAILMAGVTCLENGLARTPPMGFSTWAAFNTKINESLIRELADIMTEKGLIASGFTHLLVDDGWYAKARDSSGRLVVDSKKFPSGMRNLSAYVHGKGLKIGLWHYKKFGDALNKTGRPILYDTVLGSKVPLALPRYNDGNIWSPEFYCKGDGAKIQPLANMWWSLPVNKYACWECCVSRMQMADMSQCTAPIDSKGPPVAIRGLLPMLDSQDSGAPGFSTSGHWNYSAPGGWNYLDQLAVCLPATWQGPGLNFNEQVSMASIWAVLASPMLLAMDMRSELTSECIKLVTNKQVLAVHQDSLAVAGRRLKNFYADELHDTASPAPPASPASPTRAISAQLWVRPLTGGAFAVALFSRGAAPTNIVVPLLIYGLRLNASIMRRYVSLQ
jgi:alpha-galactosidase